MARHALGAGRRPGARLRVLFAVALLAATGSACDGPPAGGDDDPGGDSPRTAPPAPREPLFHDVAATAGLDLVNVCGLPDKPYIVDSMGAGACWLDFDRDGWLDVFIVQGSTHPQRQESLSPPPSDALYRNRGDGTFEDVTAAAGVLEQAWGNGCTTGDVDGDGWTDLYVTNHGPNVLWRNRRDGTFEDWTSHSGVGDAKWGASAAFADLDRDSDLDLFVANYVVFDWEDPMVNGGKNFCLWQGAIVFCGPRGLRLSTPTYYENLGDGRFAERTREAGFLGTEKTYGLGVVTIDFDRDGWTDLYAANDARPNHLWHNRGDGTFEDAAFLRGAGLNERGKEQAGMGVDAGDFDNDGWPDLFVTNFSQDTYTLYRNDGDLFTDVSLETGVTLATFIPLGWGAKFFDFDNDADLDLVAVNGHVYPQVEDVDTRPKISWRQRPSLLRNDGGRFVEAAAESGPGFALELTGRGGAVADYDNDGDIDVLIINVDEPPTLLQNSGARGRHWLGIELRGRAPSNRDGKGSIVTVRADGVPDQRREATTSGSYCSASDPRLHFGLRDADQASIEVLWPSGDRQTYDGVAVDRYVVAVEGEAALSPYPLAP